MAPATIVWKGGSAMHHSPTAKRAWWPAALAALLFASASHAAFITVTDPGDDASTANGTCTLREAIRAANSNTATDACRAGSATQVDVVRLPAGTYTLDLSGGTDEDASASGDLDITESVRLIGAGPGLTVIDGSQATSVDRVLHVLATAEEVTFARLTITGGEAMADCACGGNLRVDDNATVTLVDVAVENGRASSGGGIHNAGALTMHRVSIVANEALTGGASGGGLRNAGKLLIEDSTVAGNQAGQTGGGIDSDSADTMTIYRSRLAGNSAGTAGGAVASGGEIDIQYSLIEGNDAQTCGAMLTTAAGQLMFSAVLHNTAVAEGGGLCDLGGIFVRHSTLSGNTAALGGALYAQSGQTLLDNSTVARNLGGGGVHNDSGAFFEGTLIADNTGGNCTGAAPGFGAYNLEDTNTCGFVDDPANDLPNFPNTDPQIGPLADNGGPTPTMALAPGSAAIDAVSSFIRSNCQTVSDQRGRPRGYPRISGNPDDEFLCDIGAYEHIVPFVVDDVSDAADADPDDDLCLTVLDTCTLRAAVQQANAVPGHDEIVLPPGAHTLSLPGADEDMATTGDLDLVEPVTIRGAGAEISIVAAQGGDRVFDVRGIVNGMFNHPEPPEYRFENLTIAGGSVASDGGGIRAVHPVSLYRVVVRDNSAIDGGGVYCVQDCYLQVTESTFRNNSNSSNGAGFFQSSGGSLLGFAHISRSTLRNNTGGIGGAGEAARVLVDNSTITGNTAGSSAALFASSAVIRNSTIVGNSVDGDTGGMFLLDLSAIGNSIIAGNSVNGTADNCTISSPDVVSLGYNITNTDGADCGLVAATDAVLTDPVLAPVASNGGPTLTMALAAGSPAIDAGVDCLATDQRGQPRPQDGDGDLVAECDIGAFEAGGEDTDSDTVPDVVDNCPQHAPANQFDADGDGIGNICDADVTNDCLVNFADLAFLKSVFFPNYDVRADFNNDDSVNFADLAFLKATFFNSPTPGPGPGVPGNLCD